MLYDRQRLRRFLSGPRLTLGTVPPSFKDTEGRGKRRWAACCHGRAALSRRSRRWSDRPPTAPAALARLVPGRGGAAPALGGKTRASLLPEGAPATALDPRATAPLTASSPVPAEAPSNVKCGESPVESATVTRPAPGCTLPAKPPEGVAEGKAKQNDKLGATGRKTGVSAGSEQSELRISRRTSRRVANGRKRVAAPVAADVCSRPRLPRQRGSRDARVVRDGGGGGRPAPRRRAARAAVRRDVLRQVGKESPQHSYAFLGCPRVLRLECARVRGDAELGRHEPRAARWAPWYKRQAVRGRDARRGPAQMQDVNEGASRAPPGAPPEPERDDEAR